MSLQPLPTLRSEPSCVPCCAPGPARPSCLPSQPAQWLLLPTVPRRTVTACQGYWPGTLDVGLISGLTVRPPCHVHQPPRTEYWLKHYDCVCNNPQSAVSKCQNINSQHHHVSQSWAIRERAGHQGTAATTSHHYQPPAMPAN